MLSSNSLLVAFFAFAALSSAAPSPSNAPLHVPLTRRASARRSTNHTVTMDRFSQAADFIRQKYGYISSRELERRQSSSGFSITNQVWMCIPLRVPRIRSCTSAATDARRSCVAPRVQTRVISVPSTLVHRRRALTLFLILVRWSSVSSRSLADAAYWAITRFYLPLSGSSDLWLAGSQCTQCPSGTPEFDTSSSSSIQTSSDQVQINYGSGSVIGTLAKDTVSMGSFTVSDQTMRMSFACPSYLPSLPSRNINVPFVDVLFEFGVRIFL